MKSGYIHYTQINVVKPILTLVIILILGATAMAHPNVTGDEKSKTYAVDHVLDSGADRTVADEETVKTGTEVVRVYRKKNSRVKKALRFTTKQNKPKLA